MISLPEKIIIQLTDAAQDSFWYPLTDSERFGKKGSTAFMSVDWEKATGSFFGELKINEGAGFASYRNMVNLDLTGYNKLKLQVQGDGRDYKVLIKDETAIKSPAAYSYQAEFKSLNGEEQTVLLDLENFKPVYRGLVDLTLPSLKAEAIRELGLQINDGTPGPYKLDFKEWIVQK